MPVTYNVLCQTISCSIFLSQMNPSLSSQNRKYAKELVVTLALCDTRVIMGQLSQIEGPQKCHKLRDANIEAAQAA